MSIIVNLYSDKKGEISRFVSSFCNEKVNINNDLKWAKTFENPAEVVEIIGTFMDNRDIFDANMWVSLDPGVFINVTKHNVEELIKYIFERFPY